MRSVALLFLSLLSLPALCADVLQFNVHMSDCEGRWVVLPHDAEDDAYQYGFVYIDPQAGFTFHHAGYFTVGPQGKFLPSPNRLANVQLKIRLAGNGVAALLPPQALADLGLPEEPDWMKFYKDDSDPVTHKVQWGRHYNELGDPTKALTYLESAYKEQPHAERLELELAFAYNALGRTAEAMAVLGPAVSRDPKNMPLCKELAYADLTGGKLPESIKQHLACIELCEADHLAEKSEMAVNIAGAYKKLGDVENTQKWLSKAKAWAPKGSPVYNSFHPEETQ